MKRCPKCERDKERSMFHKNKCAPDGLQTWCKDCACERQAEKNKKKALERLEARGGLAAWEAKPWTCPACSKEVLGKDRPKDRSGKSLKHCGCRALQAPSPIPWHKRPEGRLRRIEYKRAMRAQRAAAAGRELIPKYVKHDAHVKEWRKWRANARKEERLAKLAQNDEERRAAIRLRWHTKTKFDPRVRENRTARRKRDRETLSDRYIVKIMTDTSSIPVSQIPPVLIQLKREHLKLKRYLKEIDDEEC